MVLTWPRIRPDHRLRSRPLRLSGKSVYVPAGNYLLNNSIAAAILSGASNVLIWGDGPATSLACNTVGGQDCIAVHGRHGIRVDESLHLLWSHGYHAHLGYAVDIETCTTCLLEGRIAEQR